MHGVVQQFPNDVADGNGQPSMRVETAFERNLAKLPPKPPAKSHSSGDLCQWPQCMTCDVFIGVRWRRTSMCPIVGSFLLLQ